MTIFNHEGSPVEFPRVAAHQGESSRWEMRTAKHGTLGYLIELRNWNYRAVVGKETSEQFKMITHAFQWASNTYNRQRGSNG
jgi:hypothetical protein